MESRSQIEVTERSSFYRKPAFWVGTLLWLGVIAVVAGLILKPPGARDSSSQNNITTSPEQTTDSPQPSIVIKTNKDGGLTIDDSGKSNSESPWDQDGIADFSFVDTEGNSVTKADLLGKPWIVCFVFTHCAATCPTVTKAMRDLQDRLKEYDFRLVTLTVDPERDTPEVLKRYGKSRGADFSRWLFLHGEQGDIYKLIHGSFKMPVKEMIGKDRQPGFEFIHSNNIMLVDAHGVVQGKFDATKDVAMSTLRREIQKLAKPLGGKVDPTRGTDKSPDDDNPEPSGASET